MLDGIPGSMLVNMPNESIMTLAELCSAKDQPKRSIIVYEAAEFESSADWHFDKAPQRNQLVKTVLDKKTSIICGEGQTVLSMRGSMKAVNLQQGDLLVTKQGLQALNDDQWQLVIGSLFGRGDLKPKGKFGAVLHIYHQKNQADYCTWKAQIMQTELLHVPGKGNYGADRVGFVTLPFACSDFSTRRIPDWMISTLDARALAIWFMDSGSLSKVSCSAILPLGNCDEDTAVRVVNRLEQINIAASYRWKKRSLEIVADEIACLQLLQAIQPYCHTSLMVKLANEIITRDKMDAQADLPADHVFRRIANIPDALRKQNATFSVESGRRTMQVVFKEDAFFRMGPKNVVGEALQGDYTHLAFHHDQSAYLWDVPALNHKLLPVTKVKVLKNKTDVDMYKLARPDCSPVVGYEVGVVFVSDCVPI